MLFFSFLKDDCRVCDKYNPSYCCFSYFSGTAGIFNWVIAIGPDTLKSRLQTGEMSRCSICSVTTNYLSLSKYVDKVSLIDIKFQACLYAVAMSFNLKLMTYGL